MRDPSWNSNPPLASFPRSRNWLWVVTLVALFISVVAFLLLINRRQTFSQASWPLLRQTALRMQTEDGARRLWERNPAIRQDYPDLAGFLSRVGEYRVLFADLPAEEPAPGAGILVVEPWPFGVQARVRSQDGTWLSLTVASIPDEAGGGRYGEGITHLKFLRAGDGDLRGRNN